MADLRLHRDLEAVLFAAGRPLSVERLAEVLSVTDAVTAVRVEAALAALTEMYAVDGARGIELANVGEGWVFRTNRTCEPALSRLFDSLEETRLSPAALEVLAIVAYMQPVSRPEIADIRGVNSDSAVHTLLDRELIREVGRRDGPGAAILYGTTERFLIAFDLRDLASLPPLDDFAVGEEQRAELWRRLGALVSPE